MTNNELAELLPHLTAEERQEVDRLLTQEIWTPLPGPQTEALESEADVLLYGGAAGGGKTDLALGLALTQHTRSIIFRREGTQLQGILDRLGEILGSREGYNGQDRIWRIPRRQIEFGSCPYLGDERKYQGRPHDLIVFDEGAHFIEAQVRFLMGWLRTTNPNQRCRVLITSNPPTSHDDEDADWLIRFFAPWLDPEHPNPAEPGELRWFAVLDGEDVEVSGPEPIQRDGETIYPQSRTYIPARVQDNPYLLGTHYETQLQSLPEPLRSQMLHGDFLAGRGDNPWQVIPARWIDAAFERWRERPKPKTPLTAIGVDVARGGDDETILAPRYDNYFDNLICRAGHETPDGPSVVALIVSNMRNSPALNIDAIGPGASVYDQLNSNDMQCHALVSSEKSEARDITGALGFANKRSEWWWRFREALDPDTGEDLALPPDPKLKSDLCAPRFKVMARGIQVERKEDIIKRIGRSPDRGDAAVYALAFDAKRTRKMSRSITKAQGTYNPHRW